MKKLNIILGSTIALSCLSYAGGDILPTVFESEEVYVPTEEAYIQEEAVVTDEEVFDPEYVAEPEFDPEFVSEPEPEYETELVAEPEYETELVSEPEYETELVEEPEYEYVADSAPITPVVSTPVVSTPTTVSPEPIVPVVSEPLGIYGGLGFSVARYETNCDCFTTQPVDKTAGVIARVGYDINDYVGVEARGIRTNWKPHGGKIKHAGVFLKPQYPVTDNIDVYGLAGYAKTTTQGSLPRVDVKSFAWGAGAEYELDSVVDGLGLFTDYERLVQKSGLPDLDTINFGVTYHF